MPKKGFTKASVEAISKLILEASKKIKKPAEVEIKAALEKERNSANLQTPEQDQHSQYGIKMTPEGKRRAYNANSSNIAYYASKGLITQDQESAAKSLYRDWYASRMVGGFKSCLNITIGGGGGNKQGMNYQAWEAYVRAHDSIHIRYRKIVIAIVCEGEWLQDVKSSVPRYRRMDALQRGLDQLVEHYGRRHVHKKPYRLGVTTTLGNP